MPETHLLNERGINFLAKNFVKYVTEACKELDLPEEYVSVSLIELSAAFREARLDLDMIQQRRKPSKGLSWGKVAGVLWFRLSRYRIVNIHDTDDLKDVRLEQKRRYYRIQDIAVYRLIFAILLRVQSPPSLMKELLYISARRHMNQEMLGALLDTFVLKGLPAKAKAKKP